jgi:hypothetical protein
MFASLPNYFACYALTAPFLISCEPRFGEAGNFSPFAAS